MHVKMQLSLPTEARYVGMMRTVTSAVMSDMGVPQEANNDVQLAVTEACANAVRHSDVGEYVVRLALGDERCEVEVVDLGGGFEPADFPAPTAAEHESGRGLQLMQELVDDLQFVRADDGTHVRLTKTWDVNQVAPAST
ncbi:MAG: ATP-binding protein [Nitriliruptorales bacterium]|nr:ATP-binding protein [Nitriliruptorales bacterium]